MILTTAVTKSCLKDFLLMKKTFEMYHPESFITVVCDKFCYDYLYDNFKNVVPILDDSINDGNHVVDNSQQKQSFKNIISKKFDLAISNNPSPSNPVLWCDVDHIFINRIDDKILTGAESYDAALTPHFSDGFADERTVGYYNCGFAIIFNDLSLHSWKTLYEKHEDFNLYYEQKPLEVISRYFNILNLPINYNFGWWKCISNFMGGNMKWINLSKSNDICWQDKGIVSWHFHYFKNDNHGYQKESMRNIVKSLLMSRGRNEDQITLHEIERLSNENIEE